MVTVLATINLYQLFFIGSSSRSPVERKSRTPIERKSKTPVDRKSRSPIDRKRRRTNSSGGDVINKNELSVFVANFPYDVKWQDLKDLFRDEVKMKKNIIRHHRGLGSGIQVMKKECTSGQNNWVFMSRTL